MLCRVVLLALVTVLVAPLLVQSLRCRQCGTYECGPLLQECSFGLVKDVCNCCPACAKGVGEVCGGAWNTAGKCAQGLQCVKPVAPEGDQYAEFNAQGTCQPSPKASPLSC